MKYRLLILVSLIVLAACEPNFVPNQDYDWCYLYDFQNMSEEDVEFITITKGEFVPGPGGGLKTVDNELVVSWTKTGLYVTADLVTIYGRRGVDSGDIGILGDFVVFGVDGLINNTLPGGIDVFAQPIPQDTAGSSGVIVNATIQTGGEIYITGLAVSGDGAPPFPQNPCDPNATPTPSTTSTPELTPTATTSITPTITRTATTSPVCMSVSAEIEDYGSTLAGGAGLTFYEYTGRLPHAFTVVNPWPGYNFYTTQVSSIGGRQPGSNATMSFQIRDAFGSNILSLGNMVLNNAVYNNSNGGRLVIFNLTSPYPSGVEDVYVEAVSGTYFWIHNVNLNICRGDELPPTATPVQTASNTPTRTATPTRTPLGTNLGPGTGTPSKTPTKTPIVLSTWTPRPTWTPPPTSTNFPTWTSPPPTNTPADTLPPPPTLDATATFITATPQTYTPVNSSTPNPITATGFGTPGGTPWGTPVGWGTPWGTPNATSIGVATGLPEFELTPEYGSVYSFLATAAYQVNGLPVSITDFVPQVDAAALFGYVKWAVSCSSVQELMGQTLAPIGCHAMIGISLNIFLAGVLVSFRIIRLCIRVVSWIIQQILRLIPFMG